MAETSARDAKLIQYLNEAYGKEKELETSLEAHIAMTTRAPYKKRLQEHLKETKGHSRQLEKRIKQIGGRDAVSELASVVTSAASRAAALAKGPLHAIRGTSEPEKMLKNAKTEYWNEFEEIATYRAIETLADTVGDAETAKLARGIRREEERMAKFLEGQIPQLTKGVAREEIPASERRRSGTTTRRARATRARANGNRARGRSRSK